MAEYLSPGVYVEEVERGAAPLEGVSTSTAGFLGPTERGPTDPRLLTSFADFERTYGGFLEDSFLADAVNGFFTNGGSRCFVGRITADDDETATESIPLETPADRQRASLLVADSDELDFDVVDDETTDTVELSHTGDEDDDDPIVIDVTTDVTIDTTMADDADFSVDWATGTDDERTMEPGDDEQLEVTFEPNSGAWLHWARLTIDPDADIAPVNVTLIGIDDDGDGDSLLTTEVPRLDLGVLAEDDDETTITFEIPYEGDDSIDINADDSDIIGPDTGDFSLEESGTIPLGAQDDEFDVDIEFDPDDEIGRREATLLLDHTGDNAPLVIDLVGWRGEAMDVDAVGPGEWGDHVALLVDDASMYEQGRNDLFKLIVRYWTDDGDFEAAIAGDADPERDDVPAPDVEEVYDDLSPHESDSNYYLNQVDGASMLIDPERVGDGRPDPGAGPIWLSGGDTNDVDRDDYEGDATESPEDRTGFAAFEKLDEIAIVCVPDEEADDVTDPLIEHCESMGDRFAILQADQNPGQVGDLRPPADTDMGAYYYPWLESIDPNTGMTTEIPPGGHIAGIYARSDASRGVHKAPANEVIRGIEGLQRTITKGEQEVLNPRGVNCLRSFRGRGIRVWGARTASSNPNWKYVNVRRLFLFLRGSIEEGTQWVVFEPNNEQLWARVRQTIKNFLTDVWDDGALMGTSPDEAFFVKCDRSTMTQSDIENGRLICEIGVAPVRPAEFVVFRISQWTGSAD